MDSVIILGLDAADLPWAPVVVLSAMDASMGSGTELHEYQNLDCGVVLFMVAILVEPIRTCSAT